MKTERYSIVINMEDTVEMRAQKNVSFSFLNFPIMFNYFYAHVSLL